MKMLRDGNYQVQREIIMWYEIVWIMVVSLAAFDQIYHRWLKDFLSKSLLSLNGKNSKKVLKWEKYLGKTKFKKK